MGMSPRLLRPRQTSRFAALRKGLTNYWPLNETATTGDVTSANWVVGGLNMTSENSVLSTAGLVGNARTFVKANSERMFGDAGTSTTLCGTADFTAAFWFRVTAAHDGALHGLVSNDLFPTERGISIYLTGDGTNWFPPLLFLEYADGSNETYQPFEQTFAASQQWHFFCVRLGGATTMECRFDSTDGTSKTLSKSFRATRQQLIFGARYSASDLLNGDIDEIAFWNRRLTDSEVGTLYNSGSGIDLSK